MKISKLKYKKYSQGFSLAEAVIVSAIASSFIIVLSLVNANYVSYALSQSNIIGGNYLAEESLEATKFMRDKSWSGYINGLAANYEYYLYFDGNNWTATTTVESNTPFIRTVRFDNVYRDGSDNIAAAGTLDSGTRLITTTVSWPTKTGTSTKILQTYLTNAFNN